MFLLFAIFFSAPAVADMDTQAMHDLLTQGDCQQVQEEGKAPEYRCTGPEGTQNAEIELKDDDQLTSTAGAPQPAPEEER